jgi:bifunctional DNase/RNase
MSAVDLVEMDVVKVSPYLREDRPLLWLSERKSVHPRLLPIAIGEFEAAAIQMQLDQVEPERPISYDLITSMVDNLDVTVQQIVIHSVRDQIYYAQVAIERGELLENIDSRPSDAVALALRTGSPIFVSLELLETAGWKASDTDVEVAISQFAAHDEQLLAPISAVEAQATYTLVSRKSAGEDQNAAAREEATETAGSEEGDALDELHARLEQAIVREEYEAAARLRDEIETLESSANS